MGIGSRLALPIDEGIYLEGAERVANGQVPYRDFFTFTGPGCFWLYGAVFRIFGASLASARVVLCIEIALMCAAIYWIVRCYARPLFAAAATFLFLAMLLTSPYELYETHRWDSNTFAILAVAFTWAGTEHGKKRHFALAGACAATAAWMTPPFCIVVVAIAIWMIFAADVRKKTWLYVAGVALPSVLAIGVLLYQGALGKMLQDLLWVTTNYGPANRVGWGAVTGDSPTIFPPGISGARLIAATIHFVEGILPALLPPIAYLGWILLLSRRKISISPAKRLVTLLLTVSVALLAACYPRFGGNQLWFASAVFWILCSYLLYFAIPERRRVLGGAGLLATALVVLFSATPSEPARTLNTRIGEIDVSQRHYILISTLQRSIHEGDSLFVFPYLPVLYFVLGAHNPTRYSFLQPGMMGPQDEAAVVADLRANPPHWIVWHDFSDRMVLKNWPHSDPARMRYPAIEAFFAEGYHLANPETVARAGYSLLERNQGQP